MVKLEISNKLYKALKKSAKESGFKSVKEYVEFMLKELVKEGEEITPDEEKKIKERLKALGYL